MKKHLPLLVGCIVLQACGGGGGGGGTPLTYTSYTAAGLASSKDITVNGSYAATAYSGGSDATSLTVYYTLLSHALISYAKLQPVWDTAQTFDTNAGDTIATFTRGVIGVRSDGDGAIFHRDSYSFYGIWERKLSPTSWRVYGGHAGTTTSNPVSHVSTATYSGHVMGILSAIGYSSIVTVGDFTASANFSAGSMSLASSNTRGISLSGTDLGSYAGENFSGTLTSQNANTYAGTLTAANGLTGSSYLKVYGPAANSVAGNARLTNAGSSRLHVVAFGGTR